MSHFAQIDENNIVIQVVVAEQDFINSGSLGDPSKWIQTSYNTLAGEHPGGKPFRKNFAGIGYTYDSVRDAFIPPKVYESWILNENTCQWESPIPYPDNGKRHYWDEEQVNWIELVIEE